MWWLRYLIILFGVGGEKKPRIEVSPSLFARDCMYSRYSRFESLIDHVLTTLLQDTYFLRCIDEK